MLDFIGVLYSHRVLDESRKVGVACIAIYPYLFPGEIDILTALFISHRLL
uniref:Uncharacterized protein n=1 Tax=Anguilla anguilla TaxID=7936 RepID=A0A0E9UF66_ANGAN